MDSNSNDWRRALLGKVHPRVLLGSVIVFLLGLSMLILNAEDSVVENMSNMGSTIALGRHSSLPVPSCREKLTPTCVFDATMADQALLEYMFPRFATPDVNTNWVIHTDGCRVSEKCWCFHVIGSMEKARNPDGAKKCQEKIVEPHDCTNIPQAKNDCGCMISNTPEDVCLFGDMRPVKLVSLIALARAKGVTHIIEEGRYGGLSAHIYAMFGFKVSSIEFLPLADAKEGLARLSPGVVQIDGDGSVEVPKLVASLPADERVVVIFDGEKRNQAWDTYQKIKDRTVFTVFDDTNVDAIGKDAAEFRERLDKEHEIYWHSDDPSYQRICDLEGSSPLGVHRLAESLQAHKKFFLGGMDNLFRFHFTFTQGGQWELPNE